MTPERFQRAKQLFTEASMLPEGERSGFVRRVVGDDDEMQRFLEGLLAADAEPHEFVQTELTGGGARALAAEIADEESSEAEAAQPLPERIGQYAIIRRIGEGGMGVVYQAQQDSPKRMVALKVIRAGLAARHMQRRFRHEAEILGHLSHAGIANIHEAGMAEVRTDSAIGIRLPFFAMEYIEGEALNDYAHRHDLSVQDRLELFDTICDAVQHAHQKGVIHRDLKPANILVDAERQPKILDFGVARLTNADIQTVTMQTGVGELIGTIPYMSPEQVTGDSRQLDTRSDVYALGVILYELLCGSLPHDVRKLSIPEAARRIRDEEPQRLGSIDRTFRGEIEAIVGKAMEKDRDRRYQSAAALREDLRRHLNNEPLLAAPPGTMDQLAKFAKRHKLLLGGLTGAFAVLIVSVVVVSMLWGQARREALRAQAFGEFLHRTLTSADPEVAQGRQASILGQMLEDSLERAETELNHLPGVQASVLHTVGVTYLSLGLHHKAEPPLRLALEKRRAMYGDASLDVAETLFQLGKTHLELDIPVAEADFRMALRIVQELLGEEHPLTACTQVHLAYALVAYGEKGKLQQAERLCRKSLALLRRASDDAHDGNCLPMCLRTLAWILDRRGDQDGAASVLTESLHIEEVIFGPNSPSVSGTLAYLGRVARHKGDLATAESYLRQALAARSHVLGDRHLAMAFINGQLALTLRDQRKFDEAEAHCLVMLDIYLDSLGIDSRYITDTLIDLNSILIARNDMSYARQFTGRLMERLRGAYPGKESRLAELRLHLLVPEDG